MSLRYTLHSAKPNPELKSKSITFSVNQEKEEEKKSLEDFGRWFGNNLAHIFMQIHAMAFKDMEEIRLRVNRPLLIRGHHKELFIDGQGRVVAAEKGYRVQREDVLQALERMTQSSLYAAEEEMKQGFITLPGGHRVGITGEAIMKNGEVQTLKHISALNIRLAKAVEGRAELILPKLLTKEGALHHTLILSPPRGGKTTLLRDLIRRLSDGSPGLNLPGQTVGVVDERRELAGMWQGIPAYNLGCRTDILDGCPKRMGINMLIRSMAPQVVAVDELGHPEDVEAVLDALRTGVKILSTAHASNMDEALKRPTLRSLFELGVFERVVVLSRRQGPGTVEEIIILEQMHKSHLGMVRGNDL
ncbi:MULTISPECIES: stage III sporulation protein AA [Desulfitobacterium]|uniref:Stage III sporulation protein AA n=1 Tax=Desulfitobacterium dehalogenans (strain ATCC 51507 / DSM 9161 / JW/IU-DC1) TaxID=756499 RepID=I4ABB9_DESDJ|nr:MULTISPECIES: stage III sporulation protein AA [Desulfitobacterium]AFM01254.1 stage III sporulation protein AA [Desulfitobacterium dehalogenans ATCC 51507]